MRCLLISCLAFLLFAIYGLGQERGNIRIMFYNTQNLFDTFDDPATNDQEFTPSGRLRWTWAKYNQKLNNTYKTIAAVGTWQPPEVIGFCEVENQTVLNDLITKTPLAKFNYGIVHYNSMDSRGIDVALLYNKDKATVLMSKPIRVQFPGLPNRKSRDILFVKLKLAGPDTVYFFVNHWPSRREGELESEPLRNYTAKILRQAVDSLTKLNPWVKIVIMGDFNDEPFNASIAQNLKAKEYAGATTRGQLYNLSYNLLRTQKIGSHIFKGQWQVLDQIIVSAGLLNPLGGYCADPKSVKICQAAFLLQTDKRNVGAKTFPTYAGPRYLGGYSDHLPVSVDLFLKK